MKSKHIILLSMTVVFLACSPQQKAITWKHLSSANGDIEVPNASNQQTATAVLDINKDGLNDFIITERTAAPSVVGYIKNEKGWKRIVIDDTPLRIEAGSAVSDIDGDGDPDIVFGGDGRCNQVWWWENPYPDIDPQKPWVRRLIKDGGGNKHHDQIFGDFDGDGREELVFWNQGDKTLYLSEIPANPGNAGLWNLTAIYKYSPEPEPPQRGTYPKWKGKNEHEGLAKADMDGDGVLDIIGGGRWFKHEGNAQFSVHVIDEGYAFSRTAVGQFIPGGRPEVVLVVGDGTAPLIIYQWQNDQWQHELLVDSVRDGHSIDVLDFNGDGHPDIFNAEMQLGKNPEPRTRILLGDGAGNFQIKEVIKGFGLHESRIVDLDGDGDYDILGKPYTWEAPRLDIWLNQSK